jgi:hypothetical protein
MSFLKTHLNRDQSETAATTFYYPVMNCVAFCVSGIFNIDRTNKCVFNFERKCHGQQMAGKEKSFQSGP